MNLIGSNKDRVGIIIIDNISNMIQPMFEEELALLLTKCKKTVHEAKQRIMSLK